MNKKDAKIEALKMAGSQINAMAWDGTSKEQKVNEELISIALRLLDRADNLERKCENEPIGE
jgi:hypothetical protein